MDRGFASNCSFCGRLPITVGTREPKLKTRKCIGVQGMRRFRVAFGIVLLDMAFRMP